MTTPLSPYTPQLLADWVQDARERTLALVQDLSDEAMHGPRLAIVNPPLWEIGHVAWFQERWVLRHAYRGPAVRADSDRFYDSSAIAHDLRWDLPLPSRTETIAYLDGVRDAVVECLRRREPTAAEAYFVLLTIFHEDMHGEAFTYTRQTFGYPAPSLSGTGVPAEAADGGPLDGDAEIPGGTFLLGATPEEPFVFDNEKWAHAVELPSFKISRAPVTQAAFAEFVENGGYRRAELWSPGGWRWRTEAEVNHPVYWRPKAGGGWERRDFDRWLPLEPYRPVLHVNWYEANAYCRWAGRRLPTEAEWEAAAAAEFEPGTRRLSSHKRRFPWGDAPPTADRANLDSTRLGCVDVAALPAADSAFGCRGFIGNVWEWTADDFLPYPGFVADPYKEYSAPWFGTHKVLRGGCWATRARLLRNTWRNFYTPDRRDIWSGFRTCAVRP